MRKRGLLVPVSFIFAAAVFFACSDSEPRSSKSDAGDTDTGLSDGGELEGCVSMDILFVIDDSSSMIEEQANLAANAPLFMGVLDDYEDPYGNQLEYRVAVTTTDPSPDKVGVFHGEDCDLGANPWLDGPGESVAEKFACMSEVGINGSGLESPFPAIVAALGELSESNGPNHGFYRDNQASLLVIVIISDEDDRSEMKAHQVIAFLDELTGGPGQYAVVAIAGVDECTSAFGDAIEAVDLKDFVDLAGSAGYFGDICAGDLWLSLEQALELAHSTCTDLVDVE